MEDKKNTETTVEPRARRTRPDEAVEAKSPVQAKNGGEVGKMGGEAEEPKEEPKEEPNLTPSNPVSNRGPFTVNGLSILDKVGNVIVVAGSPHVGIEERKARIKWIADKLNG